MEKTLKIFVYNSRGEKIKEDSYSNFIYVFNEVLDHNVEYEGDEWNMIHGFSFPPAGLVWSYELNEWIEDSKTPFKLEKKSIAQPIKLF